MKYPTRFTTAAMRANMARESHRDFVLNLSPLSRRASSRLAKKRHFSHSSPKAMSSITASAWGCSLKPPVCERHEREEKRDSNQERGRHAYRSRHLEEDRGACEEESGQDAVRRHHDAGFPIEGFDPGELVDEVPRGYLEGEGSSARDMSLSHAVTIEGGGDMKPTV